MILVSGGTGMVGSAVVTELLKRGEPVAVLGRDKAKVARAFASTVEAREADVTQPAALASAFEGVDVVVNAVQFPTSPIEVPRKGWTFEEVDYRGTVNQVEAAKAARGLSWAAVASEMGDGVSVAMLTRLKDGGRVSIHLLAAVAAWLDAPMEAFTVVVEEPAPDRPGWR